MAAPTTVTCTNRHVGLKPSATKTTQKRWSLLPFHAPVQRRSSAPLPPIRRSKTGGSPPRKSKQAHPFGALVVFVDVALSAPATCCAAEVAMDLKTHCPTAAAAIIDYTAVKRSLPRNHTLSTIIGIGCGCLKLVMRGPRLPSNAICQMCTYSRSYTYRMIHNCVFLLRPITYRQRLKYGKTDSSM